MALQSLKAIGGVVYDLNTEFGLEDDTSYLLSCNDGAYTVFDVADADPVPDAGIERNARDPLIVKPVDGETIYAKVPFGGTLVLTEAP